MQSIPVAQTYQSGRPDLNRGPPAPKAGNYINQLPLIAEVHRRTRASVPDFSDIYVVPCREKLGKKLVIGRFVPPVTISIGIATFDPDQGASWPTLSSDARG